MPEEKNLIWIDTATGTWGQVSHGAGLLVLVAATDDEVRALDGMPDSEIADYGLTYGSTPVLP